MNKEFVIIGASGHGKVVIEIIEEMGDKIVGVVDDNPLITDLMGYSVSNQHVYKAPVIVTIGNNLLRKRRVGKVEKEFGIAIHPKANISSRCNISAGSVIMAGVTINSGVTIGKHCIINTSASVDHDCQILDFAHISPNASIGGNVIIGEGAHIGIGSVVIQGIQIGKWVTIGAGSVIINDVPDYAVVVGVPGNIIKYNKE